MQSKSESMPHTELGFSLIELLITLSIAAILLALAAPSYQSFIERNRLVTASDELFSSLSYARSEALIRRDAITLCARTATGTSCDTTGTSEDYAKGWLVFLDNNNNNTYDTATDELLRLTDSFNGSISITGDTAHAAHVIFSLSGRVNSGAATFTVQSGGVTFRTLELNRSGSAYY